MITEYNALIHNKTWTCALASTHGKIIVCKWAYMLKYKPDGTFDHYKDRLVAKGFHQTHGIDYFETFCLFVNGFWY